MKVPIHMNDYADSARMSLDAQNQLAQAELSLVQAEIGYQLSVAGVKHATGTLLENHKVKIEDVAP